MTEKVRCCRWNMSIAAEKTEVMVLTWDGKEVSENVVVKYDGAVLKTTKVKKILGIALDSNPTLKEHIKEKTKAGLATLLSSLIARWWVGLQTL